MRVRFNFLNNFQPSEGLILDCICSVYPVSIRDIFIGSNHCIIVLNDATDLTHLQTDENKRKLADKNLHLAASHTPGDSKHDRTLFITQLRPFLANYSPDELTKSVTEQNNVKVESLFIVKRHGYQPGQNLSLKITFSSLEDTDKILTNGIKIMRLDRPPKYIFKEDPIVVEQCYKCLQFGHSTRKCTQQLDFCSHCAGKHHFRKCTSTFRKCLLCGGDHFAVDRACPERKAHIRKLLDQKILQRRQRNSPSSDTLPAPNPPSAPAHAQLSSTPAAPSHVPPPLNNHDFFPHLTVHPRSVPLSNDPPLPPPNSIPPLTVPPSRLTCNNNTTELPTHGWDARLSVMHKFAEMYAKGDPFTYLEIMNQFLTDNHIPSVPPPTRAPPQNTQTPTTSALKFIPRQVELNALTKAKSTPIPPSASSPSLPPDSPFCFPKLSPIPGTPTQTISFPRNSTPTKPAKDDYIDPSDNESEPELASISVDSAPPSPTPPNRTSSPSASASPSHISHPLHISIPPTTSSPVNQSLPPYSPLNHNNPFNTSQIPLLNSSPPPSPSIPDIFSRSPYDTRQRQRRRQCLF